MNASTQDLERHLTPSEYYHAAVGSSSVTLENARCISFVLEGQVEGEVNWQKAIHQVVAVHPVTRLRMQGTRSNARWTSGPAMRLRFIQHDGDGLGQAGSDFLGAVPLSLQGPCSELVVVSQPQRTLLVLRVLHAVMDGRGMMLLLTDLFRALRGEVLQGGGQLISDQALMQSLKIARGQPPCGPARSLTGMPGNIQGGDRWIRVAIPHAEHDVLARVAVALADYAQHPETGPVTLAIPVDLRRHVPGGYQGANNMAAMLKLQLGMGESREVFRGRLKELLDRRADAYFWPALSWIRWLPMTWLDRWVSRPRQGAMHKQLLESAVISYVGRYRSAALSGGGFNAEALYGLPIPGASCFIMILGLDERVDVCLGMPAYYASEGRLEALGEQIQRALSSS